MIKPSSRTLLPSSQSQRLGGSYNLELALEARDEGIRRVAANNEQFLNVAGIRRRRGAS